MRIGILTDTHLPNVVRTLDDLGPHIGESFSNVDLILHGGDIVSPSVLDWLEQFAEVVAALGNNDVLDDDRRVAPVQVLDLEGWRIGMVHSIVPHARAAEAIVEACFSTPVDIVVSGHTHHEVLEYREGVVFINSGSPVFPHHKSARLGTVALLDLEPGQLRAEIVVLGETPGRPNPGRAGVIELSAESV